MYALYHDNTMATLRDDDGFNVYIIVKWPVMLPVILPSVAWMGEYCVQPTLWHKWRDIMGHLLTAWCIKHFVAFGPIVLNSYRYDLIHLQSLPA